MPWGLSLKKGPKRMTKSVDWIEWNASKWIAGTATLSALDEYILFRLCMFAYDAGRARLEIVRDDLVAFCKYDERAFLDAIGRLAARGKLTVEPGIIIIDTVDRRLNQARERIQKNHDRTEKAREKVNGKPRKKVLKPKEKPAATVTDGITRQDNTEHNNTEQDRKEGDLAVLEACVRSWNDLAGRCNLAQVQVLTDARKSSLRARLKEAGGIAGFEAALAKVEASPFLLGQSGKDWKADFDFVVAKSKFTKILEGGYDRNASGGKGQNASRMQQGFENIQRGRKNGE